MDKQTNMKKGNIIFCMLFLLIIISCKKEIDLKSAFLTGDKDGTVYELISPAISIIPLGYSEKDTITSDTLNLDIDSDGFFDFKFILSQKFVPSGGYGNHPPQQELVILVSNNVRMQYHTVLSGKNGYVKTSSIGDTIDVNRPWVSQRSFNLISRFNTVIIAPSFESPFIPFMIEDTYNLGWFKFGIDYSSSNVFERFYIDEYCLLSKI